MLGGIRTTSSQTVLSLDHLSCGPREEVGTYLWMFDWLCVNNFWEEFTWGITRKNELWCVCIYILYTWYYFASILHVHGRFLDWKKKLSMNFLKDWVAPKPCPSKDPHLVESCWSPISRCLRVRPKKKVERPEQAEANVRGSWIKAFRSPEDL